jgi:hypothetical protein
LRFGESQWRLRGGGAKPEHHPQRKRAEREPTHDSADELGIWSLDEALAPCRQCARGARWTLQITR